MPSMACCTCGGRLGRAPRRESGGRGWRACAPAFDSGRWTPVRPCSPHTTPQVPIAVSKSVKCMAMFTGQV